jgi:hypothetical protein
MALNTAKTFSMEIERLANEKNITHMSLTIAIDKRLNPIQWAVLFPRVSKRRLKQTHGN